MRKETRCHHIGYSYRLTARVILYAPSHRQDNTYHGLCYTSRGALVGTRNSSMCRPHEGSIRRPIAPWANALPLSYVPLPSFLYMHILLFWLRPPWALGAPGHCPPAWYAPDFSQHYHDYYNTFSEYSNSFIFKQVYVQKTVTKLVKESAERW